MRDRIQWILVEEDEGEVDKVKNKPGYGNVELPSEAVQGQIKCKKLISISSCIDILPFLN